VFEKVSKWKIINSEVKQNVSEIISELNKCKYELNVNCDELINKVNKLLKSYPLFFHL